MTTYNAASVTDAVIAYQKPITLQQGRALRDNPLAVAEADATAPASLLPTVLLGTLTTTSGTTQTLSSLVLTPYKLLRIIVSGVSFTITTQQLTFASKNISDPLSVAPQGFYGMIAVDLVTGVAIATIGESNAGASAIAVSRVLTTGYTTATTSITFAGGTFDAGSILVYGEK